MNLVIFHVLGRIESPETGAGILAAPGLSPDERVVVWEGFAPLPAPEHPAVAPVVLWGEREGRQAYVEQVPLGVCMADAPLPVALVPCVVHQVLLGLDVLHRARLVHGAVAEARIHLGADGRVVLIGRGRRGGLPALDIVAALSLLPDDPESSLPGGDAAEAAAAVAGRVGPQDVEQLAAFVAEHLPARPAVAEQVVLEAGNASDFRADEVVPDIGTDTGEGGILDRWSATGSGTTEATPEVTDASGTAQQRLALSLWGRLAAAPAHLPAPDRFDAVRGVASRGIRALLADEPPDPLPVPLVARVGSFALPRPEVEDHPTVETPVGLVAGLPRMQPPAAPRAEGARRRLVELLLAMLAGAILFALISWLLGALA